jgi:hypothetical protein
LILLGAFFCQVWLQCLSKIFYYVAHAVCSAL